MDVLLTCKNEEDSIKNEGPRVLSRIYVDFQTLKAGYSTISCEIPPKFELIQAFMVVRSTCKNEDPIKNKGARALTTFLPL